MSKYKPAKTDASRKNLRQKIKPNTNRKIQENSVRFCRNNLTNQTATVRSLGQSPSLTRSHTGEQENKREGK